MHLNDDIVLPQLSDTYVEFLEINIVSSDQDVDLSVFRYKIRQILIEMWQVVAEIYHHMLDPDVVANTTFTIYTTPAHRTSTEKNGPIIDFRRTPPPFQELELA